MNREEREQLLKDTLIYFAPHDRYVTDEKGNKYYREDVTLKAMELSEPSLPPAEGAVNFGDIYELLGRGIDKIMRGESSLGALADEAETFINSEVKKRLAQQQPTAEGAEAFLDEMELGEPLQTGEFYYRSEVLEAMEKFATLHAQRIAEKMVEEQLPSNKEIHEAALAWARDHSEAPDKDCPEWLIRDYEAGAYFVRQCYGCWNKTDKMVSERLREELMNFARTFNDTMDRPDDNYISTTDIDEYLKTRER